MGFFPPHIYHLARPWSLKWVKSAILNLRFDSYSDRRPICAQHPDPHAIGVCPKSLLPAVLSCHRNPAFREYSALECRQGFTFPSAVSRMRLHSPQKWALTGLIRPILPSAPGRWKSLATPPSLAAGTASGRASKTLVNGIYASGPKPELSHMGIISIKRTSTGYFRVSSASGRISSSLNPPMSTALSLIF